MGFRRQKKIFNFNRRIKITKHIGLQIKKISTEE